MEMPAAISAPMLRHWNCSQRWACFKSYCFGLKYTVLISQQKLANSSVMMNQRLKYSAEAPK